MLFKDLKLKETVSNRRMNKIGILIIAVIFFYSCSDYQKALKSEDSAVKYEEAMKQYEDKNYTGAIRLFEDIAPAYRGKPQAEKMFYYLANSYYNSRQYYLAGYQYESFISAYPKSEKVEEASYAAAECFSKLSPEYSLDQTDTFKALDKLQAFIDEYPNSKFVALANLNLRELLNKLEKKEYENAKLYNTIEDHKSAIVALDNFMSDYPGTKYKEDALYYKLDSSFHIAANSVLSKKEERLLTAKTAYSNLLKYYSDSRYKKEADIIYAQIEQELQKFQIK